MKTPQQIRNEVEKELRILRNIAEENMRQHDCSFEEGLMYHKNKYHELDAKLSILTEYDKSIKEIIEHLENPYPEDIYPRIEPERFKDINDTLKEIFGFPLDRLSAHLMRIARENVKRELLSKIGDNSEVKE